MPEPVVEIPNRPAFRASEVCEIAQIPAYVLKSWEKEFPGLGVLTKPGGPRVYRRADVEQVVRIKHLLFAEGLTLAGARRKLEGEPKAEEEALPDLSIPGEVREKMARIKQDLRGLLALLSAPGPTSTTNQRAAATARASNQEPAAPATPEAAPEAVAPTVAHAANELAAMAPPATRNEPGTAAAPRGTSQPDAATSQAPDAGADLPLLDGVTEDATPPDTRKSRRGPRRKA